MVKHFGMNTAFETTTELKKNNADEWLLLGNPEIKDTAVLVGIVLYHSKDKKEVCYIGRNKTKGYSSITLAYSGDSKKRRSIGTLKTMKAFKFPVPGEEEVVLVDASIEGIYKFRLALDAAAAHTTVDRSVLFLSGYGLKESKGEREIETSKGIIVVELYDIEQFECLGIVKPVFEVQVYRFLAHGITSDYDGVAGLNF